MEKISLKIKSQKHYEGIVYMYNLYYIIPSLIF